MSSNTTTNTFGKLGQTCANCLKHPTTPLMRCTGCKSPCYCSKDCQRAHWKKHKPRCQATKASKARTKEIAGKVGGQGFPIFQRWREEARAILIAMSGSLMPSRHALEEQPPHQFLWLKVDLDWNRRTFVPLEIPTWTPLDEASSLNDGSTLQDTLKLMFDQQRAETNAYFHVVLVQFHGLKAVLPMWLVEETYQRYRWSDILLLLKAITVKSSLFEEDVTVVQDFVKRQIISFWEQDQILFSSFLCNALHIGSTKPRHKTHVIVVELKTGLKRGEILSFENYQVQPLSQVLRDLDQLPVDDMSPAQKKDFRENSL